METKKQIILKVKMEDMGLYIKTLQMDHTLGDAKGIAKLITKHFKVECEEIDVLHYEGLLNHVEDYERESRIVEYSINPFKRYKDENKIT